MGFRIIDKEARFITATFSSRALEKAYQRYAIDRSIGSERKLLGLIVGFYLVYAILDYEVLGDVASVAFGMRLVVAAGALLCIAVTYLGWGRQNYSTLIAGAFAAGGISVSAMIALAGAMDPPYYVGLIVCALMFVGLFSVNFVTGTLVLLVYYTSFAIATADLEHSGAVFSAHFFLITSFTTCAIANYILEINRRSEFLQVQRKDALENQLRGMIEDANSLLEAKNAMFNILGHICRTPLHQIIGYADLLTHAANDDALEYSAEISRASRTLLRQTQRIFQYSRADSDLLAASIRTCRLAEIVDNALDRCTTPDERSNVSVPPLETDLRVLGDATLLADAIAEVIDNAVTHGGADHGITITASRHRDIAILLIRDSGPGIEPALLSAALDPLAAIKDFKTMGGDQFSVGLPLADRYLRRTGALLRLASYPGKGTLVTIEIPIAPETDPIVAAAS